MSGPSWEKSTQARQPGICLSRNLLLVIEMSTASKRFAFQLSPALAAASRASVNVDVPVFGKRKDSAGIALDTEAGETTAGEGVVETLTAPTWSSPPLVSGMPTKPSPPVIAGTDVLLGSESGMDCGAAIKRS